MRRVDRGWYEPHGEETTDDLLALGAEWRIDSLVCAFEQAIQAVATRRRLSDVERCTLMITSALSIPEEPPGGS